MTATPTRRPESARPLAIRAGAAGAAWVLAYGLNRRFWVATLDLVGLDEGSRLYDAVLFFLYDTVKILLLVVAVSFAVGIVSSFVPPERARRLLGGRRAWIGYALAVVLGVVTPFCSCSSIPIFLGLVAAGVPLGITLTFLVASPLIQEIGAVLLWSEFGLPTALLYVTSGAIIAVVVGLTLGRERHERHWEPLVLTARAARPALSDEPDAAPSWDGRISFAAGETRDLLRRIWKYLLAGIAIGAVVHGWVPADAITDLAGPSNPFGPFLATVLGVPLYANAVGVLPLIEVLDAKGVPMGTLLSLLMSTIALSVPELILLRKVMRPRMLAYFVAVMAVSITFTGYLFNAVLS
ncbi:MAG: permease [Actinomycetota bacterium]|nr:permease [Actinomycetota bacterium]